jgi:hypothetical protein
VIRRLIASMIVVACLLSIVQPAIACANCVSTDCCPAGSSDQRRPASPDTQARACCALGAALAPSLSALGARTLEGRHASASSPGIALPAGAWVASCLGDCRTRVAQVSNPINESLIYLLTARLRL